MAIDFLDLRKGPKQPSWLTEGDKERTSRVFSEGWRMAQERKAYDLRERQFQLQKEQVEGQLEIQRRIADQNATLGKLRVEAYLRKQDDQIRAEKSFGEVSNMMSRHEVLGIAGTDASEAALLGKIGNSPNFYDHPGAKTFMQDMAAKRKTIDLASRRRQEAQDNFEKQVMMERERGLRAAAAVAGRQGVAETKAAADIKRTTIRAEADLAKAKMAASKWADHAAFHAFTIADDQLAKQNLPADQYEAGVKDLYRRFLPSGEPNVFTPSAAAPTAPRWQWTPSGINQIQAQPIRPLGTGGDVVPEDQGAEPPDQAPPDAYVPEDTQAPSEFYMPEDQ